MSRLDWGIKFYDIESSSIASSGPGAGRGIAAGEIGKRDGENDRLGEGDESDSDGEVIWDET
jgi:hypothetical protein